MRTDLTDLAYQDFTCAKSLFAAGSYVAIAKELLSRAFEKCFASYYTQYYSYKPILGNAKNHYMLCVEEGLNFRFTNDAMPKILEKWQYATYTKRQCHNGNPTLIASFISDFEKLYIEVVNSE